MRRSRRRHLHCEPRRRRAYLAGIWLFGISALAALRAAGRALSPKAPFPHTSTARAAAPRLILWNLITRRGSPWCSGDKLGPWSLPGKARAPLRARRCEWPPLHLQRAPAPFTTNKTLDDGQPIDRLNLPAVVGLLLCRRRRLRRRPAVIRDVFQVSPKRRQRLGRECLQVRIFQAAGSFFKFRDILFVVGLEH